MMTKRIIALALLAACTATSSTGFLEDYSDLRPDAQHPGRKSWRKPGIDLRDYDTVMIDPVEVFAAVEGTIDELASQQAATQLRDALAAALAPYYRIVTDPGLHTLRIRAALTNVTASGAGLDTAKSGLQAELLDPESAVRLAAVDEPVESSKGTPATYRSWARQLLDFMDSAPR